MRVPVSAPLCALTQHLTPSSTDKWYIHAAFAINTRRKEGQKGAEKEQASRRGRQVRGKQGEETPVIKVARVKCGVIQKKMSNLST